jgi:hypothetical protein
MRYRLRSSIAAVLAASLLFSSIGFNSAEAYSRHYRRGNAAAMGAVLGVFGNIAALAARDQYYDYYGPPYGGPYYGGPYAYYPPVYRHRYWHHYHHHW